MLTLAVLAAALAALGVVPLGVRGLRAVALHVLAALPLGDVMLVLRGRPGLRRGERIGKGLTAYPSATRYQDEIRFMDPARRSTR